MLAAYRSVFSHRGAAAFSATGILARLPISMMTLGIVLLVSAVTGSYALAGQVSAAYVVGNAVVAVPHGRLADRYGQAVVLYVDAVLFALATAMLVHATTHGWSSPWPHVWAALSGAALPQVGSMVRARWAHLVRDDSERHTAFAVEAVGDEVGVRHRPGTGDVPVDAACSGDRPAGRARARHRRHAAARRPARHGAGARRRPPAGRTGRPCPGHGCCRWRWRRSRWARSSARWRSRPSRSPTTTVTRRSPACCSASSRWGACSPGWSRVRSRGRPPDHRRFQVGVGVLAAAMFALPFLDGLVVLGVLLFLVGLALAPTPDRR